ncbi:phosphate ABC transporter ATP-binding protein PstB [Oceanobacillus luteolus]|uniref:Phosphate ABC transporter ATP-binding protein PstB n=1 Tax=Oceanobacillus luteolus TaxID=1274358 RepID=A0ABW4HN56_9BACI|nr:phosphate ABC transporter ATP-binding protein PstB [Oceanobacillus luteolus]MCM3740759.1 phosphate ABC transporter ATP-binding protein PstB [Oceanobacillus luteolus]
MSPQSDKQSINVKINGNSVSQKDNGKRSVFETNDLNLWYSDTHALKGIDLSFNENEVTAIIGPSGCGKSTYIKTLNRMVELVPGVRTTGEIKFKGKNILDKDFQVEALRTQVGMVFQKANPFPKSIYDNVAYGPRIHGIRNKKVLDEIVEKSLQGASLWDEVKDRLKDNAFGLSGGQQQRLCIARCLAIEPDVILMDEPTSALDPKSTLRIEELVQELQKDYSIIMVTHNMQQAARISNKTAFFLNGEVVEFEETDKLFTNPSDSRTEDYISGRFG